MDPTEVKGFNSLVIDMYRIVSGERKYVDLLNDRNPASSLEPHATVHRWIEIQKANVIDTLMNIFREKPTQPPSIPNRQAGIHRQQDDVFGRYLEKVDNVLETCKIMLRLASNNDLGLDKQILWTFFQAVVFANNTVFLRENTRHRKYNAALQKLRELREVLVKIEYAIFDSSRIRECLRKHNKKQCRLVTKLVIPQMGRQKKMPTEVANEIMNGFIY